ncbi:MAG: hypothetical protein GY869_15695 [Planctomycetes bacterium]|nr:hypothetical protein [Planctomycetota bacterium]
MQNSNQRAEDKEGTRANSGRSPRRADLTSKEIQAAFKNCPQFPPILSLEQAAELAHLAPSTLKRLASEGYFVDSIRRGKPVAFWRDRFVVEVMELDKARQRQKNSRAQKKTPKGGDSQ